MNQKYDIVLTDAGNPVGRLLARCFRKMGYRILLCDPSPSQGEIKTFFSQDDLNFTGQIRTIVEKTGAWYLIPVFHPEVLAGHRDMFPGVIIPVDERQKLLLLDDKVETSRIAGELGILQPRSYSSPEEVERYPVVFKRSSGHGGDSVYFPKAGKALDNLVNNSAPGKYLITDEIDGEDVSVDAIRAGDYFAAWSYRVVLPKAKGVSVLRESIDCPEMVDAARRILEHIDYRGVCGMDFIREKGSGKLYFLECNPRFTGGLGSQLASGFDMPSILMDVARGKMPEQHSFKAGKLTVSRSAARDYLKRMRHRGLLSWRDIRLCILTPVAGRYE